LLIEDILLL